MSGKIEPCPWCGGDSVCSAPYGSWCAVCLRCAACGPVHDDRDRARDDWNRVAKAARGSVAAVATIERAVDDLRTQLVTAEAKRG